MHSYLIIVLAALVNSSAASSPFDFDNLDKVCGTGVGNKNQRVEGKLDCGNPLLSCWEFSKTSLFADESITTDTCQKNYLFYGAVSFMGTLVLGLTLLALRRLCFNQPRNKTMTRSLLSHC